MMTPIDKTLKAVAAAITLTGVMTACVTDTPDTGEPSAPTMKVVANVGDLRTVFDSTDEAAWKAERGCAAVGMIDADPDDPSTAFVVARDTFSIIITASHPSGLHAIEARHGYDTFESSALTPAAATKNIEEGPREDGDTSAQYGTFVMRYAPAAGSNERTGLLGFELERLGQGWTDAPQLLVAARGEESQWLGKILPISSPEQANCAFERFIDG